MSCISRWSSHPLGFLVRVIIGRFLLSLAECSGSRAVSQDDVNTRRLVDFTYFNLMQNCFLACFKALNFPQLHVMVCLFYPIMTAAYKIPKVAAFVFATTHSILFSENPMWIKCSLMRYSSSPQRKARIVGIIGIMSCYDTFDLFTCISVYNSYFLLGGGL